MDLLCGPWWRQDVVPGAEAPPGGGGARALLLAVTLVSVLALVGTGARAAGEAEFRFRGGPVRAWKVAETGAALQGVDVGAAPMGGWLRVRSASGAREAWMGDRVVLRLAAGKAMPQAILREWGLRPDRALGSGLWILQAPDVWAAAGGAEALAGEPGVEVSIPVMRRRLALHGGFAPRPDDPYFRPANAALIGQWHLENRDDSGHVLGPDTNPREAWAVTRGEGITVAICDDGFETDHPDLAAAARGMGHYDFLRDRSGAPVNGAHATCVAGMVGATGGNRVGVAGVAPAASLVSWVIWDVFGGIASDEGLRDLFDRGLQEAEVQNHSWGNADAPLLGPSELEVPAITRAIEEGRGGRGVIMVRSGGNEREAAGDVNDDGYANDPRVVAVAAVRRDGRAASYSNPGACLLVGAPSGDSDDTFDPTPNLFTTDRVGSRGFNQAFGGGDLSNYAYLDTGFSGTSASAPQISGVVALILGANPALTYRDVQQVLIHSARHYDETDPGLQTNGAGFRVSHNQGFGVPDAGQAVALARAWTTRPTVVEARFLERTEVAIPDDGLRFWVVDGAAGGAERGLRCESGLGPHPDAPTARLPLVFVGRATNEIALDLRGKAALIERGTNYFREKIAFAARAGAAFAVIYNHVDGTNIFTMGGTDYVPIPAVMIGENEGRSLVAKLAAGGTVTGQVRLDAVRKDFHVADQLLVEHVGVRVRARHDRRGDLRITLVSPHGTRSILQRRNNDREPGPDDWTYWSVQHFYEAPAGTWTAWFSDESAGVSGAILEAELILRGVAIQDADADGLDDAWERRWFRGLGARAPEDSDHDGRSNAREQVLGTDPTRADDALLVGLASYDGKRLLRLSWPASEAFEYRVLGSAAVDGSGPPVELSRVPGRFPEAEAILPLTAGAPQFFRVESVPR